jgi:50S ribosomal subunit-associated GTPase HflX
VESLLRELDLDDIPVLRVLNKADLLPAEHASDLALQFDAVIVSAVEKRGFDDLIAAAEEKLGRGLKPEHSPAAHEFVQH